MNTATTTHRVKDRSSISHIEPSFGLKKPAAGAALMLILMMMITITTASRPAQAQTETVLYNFTGGSSGANPSAGLTSDGRGNFYGTTFYGGGHGEYGTVFEMSPNGSGGWNETVLYNFCPQQAGYNSCADGAAPAANVIFDKQGNLYGTAAYGGAYGWGVVFELSPAGANWTETVLHSFTGGADGGHPLNGLIIDPAGNLYGATDSVFELSPLSGGWTEQVIYTASSPNLSGLTMDVAGNIFGGSGNPNEPTPSTLFELSPNGSGGWNSTVIHNFTGSPSDGSGAQGTPVLDQAGNVYGTTSAGGTYNDGTVYKLIPGKNGQWTEQILRSFYGGKTGTTPLTGVVLDAAGNLYGTTTVGTKKSGGTVYELVAPVGKHKNYKEKVLWSFDGTDGTAPSGLILDGVGNLYGTTYGGGSDVYYGVVFEVTP